MQVVPITSAEIKERIHQTYRMGYIKDVILPRVSGITVNDVFEARECLGCCLDSGLSHLPLSAAVERAVGSIIACD